MSASSTPGTLHAPLKDLLPFALKITQEACNHYTTIQDAADKIDDQEAVGEAVDEMMDTAYINCMLYQGASDEAEQRKGEEQLLNMRSNLKLSMVSLINVRWNSNDARWLICLYVLLCKALIRFCQLRKETRGAPPQDDPQWKMEDSLIESIKNLASRENEDPRIEKITQWGTKIVSWSHGTV